MNMNTSSFVLGFSQDKNIELLTGMLTRHGFVAGATGTGKTVTIQTMTERLSQAGVPVFVTDIKGDFSGIAQEGGDSKAVAKRVEEFKLSEDQFKYQSFPVEFWDLFALSGVPIRARLQDMGYLFLARLLSLNDNQASLLSVLYKISLDKDLTLIDFQDLDKFITFIDRNHSALQGEYGNISKGSLGAIRRKLMSLDHEGLSVFFGEPSFELSDLLRKSDEKGVVNILDSREISHQPGVYAAFIMWFLEKLFRELPEMGETDIPKLVVFLDEAHLIFKDSPKVFVDKIEQIVRLIRSKGVGIFFVTQSPLDIPEDILGQLGNKIQHALRVYTPKDQKNIKAISQSFRANENINVSELLPTLAIGEALVSFLDSKATPNKVEKVYIAPPQSHIGALDDSVRSEIFKKSPMYAKYYESINSLSAYEKISSQEELDSLAKGDNLKTQRAENKIKKSEDKNRKRYKREERKQ